MDPTSLKDDTLIKSQDSNPEKSRGRRNNERKIGVIIEKV